MRIAMVSEHASPLAALGGVDAGGQNVYVARLTEELARRGHDVTVYTRRDDPDLPDRVPLPGGA
ncbi:glycosyltransferase, partial [Streptomyces mexicanus]